MLDFSSARDGKISWNELASGCSLRTLHDLVDELIDTQLGIIRDARDADVVFQPADPGAKDIFAAGGDPNANVPWTLGHMIVHATASSEEAAAVALDLARGIKVEWRSRYETAWETVTTIAQCRQRLQESRRMRLAMLSAWPDSPSGMLWPHYYYKTEMDCFGRFIVGHAHEESHLEQLRDIMRQARAARSG